MNMKYAMRSEDTEQINVVSWANWNMNRYPELRWLFHINPLFMGFLGYQNDNSSSQRDNSPVFCLNNLEK